MKRARPRPASEWSEIVAEFTQGSESISEFCFRRDIHPKTMDRWVRHFRSPPPLPAKPSHSPFVKVNVVDSGQRCSDGAVLYLGADIRLECPAHFDVSALAQLALEVHHHGR